MKEHTILDMCCGSKMFWLDKNDSRAVFADIRKDDTRARSRFKSMSKRKCGKCGDCLPVQDRPLKEDSVCWVSLGWHETTLVIAP
ncbi:hypothetical protein NB724_001370 [Pantoea ananatis]|nr:hypothetical protein [Pantoea ananatis]MCW0334359.1 hypothetical protein [Pantoea ananatis]MCW0382672.1 hypothetical protein [Pantoea ananatis]MCW0407336.1 hypothetical protein [Pantoea ananatis]MCW0427376.1 hypothetical protein [Pantoea ananatis]